MRKRMMIAAIGAVLVAASFASAQGVTFVFRTTGFESDPGPKTLLNVELIVNGVTIRADRAVASETPGEFTLEGNVRMTLPAPSRFSVSRGF